jgi:hypothetical protein
MVSVTLKLASSLLACSALAVAGSLAKIFVGCNKTKRLRHNASIDLIGLRAIQISKFGAKIVIFPLKLQKIK